MHHRRPPSGLHNFVRPFLHVDVPQFYRWEPNKLSLLERIKWFGSRAIQTTVSHAKILSRIFSMRWIEAAFYAVKAGQLQIDFMKVLDRRLRNLSGERLESNRRTR